MPADADLALKWIFSALTTAVDMLFSVWLLRLFLSLAILLLVWKIFKLLS